ncbi:CBS domain-containing protein [Paraburkholderia tropica]|uniref:CBS domain-containing protein n=1 Tax=Paraburkholderia tropica TaxID=92647 RepID=A0A1A5XDC3_9BURK|nr:CBS domain-containing protein [Paraburkholderia tropica]OBR51185.1 CBS domain-containing protein [Paraburkholderia tropica]QNB15543.1 CBS domain-containing protein [Paraburkholderia tropica]RQN38231.1 CBS domain-containing protein [Paraburkholderia tropica]SEK07992.1 CBS domain-containing protein [Paraburkholderia tropica]
MNACSLCTREVATCGPQTSIVEAAARMRALHAGDLVVVSEEAGARQPVGVLTDRDIVLAVVSPDASPTTLYAGDVMSAPAVLAHGTDDLWMLARRMHLHGVRRLPVVGADGSLVGIVTLDDLLHAAANLLDELRLIAARQQHFEAKRRGDRA